MSRPSAVQIFSMLAIIAGAAVSYFPPPSNAAAIWALVSGFLGYGVRDLFPPSGPPGAVAPVTAGKQAGFAHAGMLLILASVAAAVMLVGCATGAAPRPTPQQLAAQVCPAAQITIASLAALEDLPLAVGADLSRAVPIVGAVCVPGAAVDLGSLQALASTALPALLRIVEGSGLAPADHDRIVLGLTVGQIVLNGALMAAGPAP
ncbi:hypothetical protein [Rugamonas sp.]|uniref:hypothetical protein n=1 Tax=Rugamonas sp. TaxID=1926287 RepID=UPI0025FD6AB1|nr:hypothetical protein [Rugamonas sp.]